MHASVVGGLSRDVERDGLREARYADAWMDG